MSEEQNIKAILECNFSGFKDEIINCSVKNIMSLKHDNYREWISVNKRVPNKSGNYLVSGKNKVWVSEFLILGEIGGWVGSAFSPIVEAWMPLPEPYKEEEE